MAFETIKTDLLVLGGGVAGLRAAVAAAEKGVSVLLVSKGGCASPEIMGLNAPILPEDSAELPDFCVRSRWVAVSRICIMVSRSVICGSSDGDVPRVISRRISSEKA